MKCERCGNQLDDTDLFCQKCGKAVFEEYMDDDDIWDEYDREPKVKPEEKLEISKEIQPEKESKTENTKESPREGNKQEEPETDGAEQNSRAAAELAEAREMAENAVLEAVMLAAHVKADKVSKAVKLIDRKDCLDDDGKFSREKASAAVTELLKTWTELTDKAEDGGPGFTIGGDGQEDKSKKAPAKKTAQKSWNRFNY